MGLTVFNQFPQLTRLLALIARVVYRLRHNSDQVMRF